MKQRSQAKKESKSKATKERSPAMKESSQVMQKIRDVKESLVIKKVAK